jgi:hypothetical protein
MRITWAVSRTGVGGGLCYIDVAPVVVSLLHQPSESEHFRFCLDLQMVLIWEVLLRR